MKHAAFSLVEVLVSLAVALSIAASLARSSSALSGRRAAEERRLATSLAAEAAIEEMLALPPEDLVEGQTQADVAGPFGGLHVRRTIEHGPEEGLWLLRVTVADRNGGVESSLSTLRRRPWW
jgi:type II secretory pathway pseudopilin PulG